MPFVVGYGHGGYLSNETSNKPKPTNQEHSSPVGESAIASQTVIGAHRGGTESSGGLRYNTERVWEVWKAQSKEVEPYPSMERLLD